MMNYIIGLVFWFDLYLYYNIWLFIIFVTNPKCRNDSFFPCSLLSVDVCVVMWEQPNNWMNNNKIIIRMSGTHGKSMTCIYLFFCFWVDILCETCHPFRNETFRLWFNVFFRVVNRTEYFLWKLRKLF
jgi:hypothetical protein